MADDTPAPIIEDGGREDDAATAEIQSVAPAEEIAANAETAMANTPPPDEAKPARRGWWRRGEA